MRSKFDMHVFIDIVLLYIVIILFVEMSEQGPGFQCNMSWSFVLYLIIGYSNIHRKYALFTTIIVLIEIMFYFYTSTIRVSEAMTINTLILS